MNIMLIIFSDFFECTNVQHSDILKLVYKKIFYKFVKINLYLYRKKS